VDKELTPAMEKAHVQETSDVSAGKATDATPKDRTAEFKARPMPENAVLEAILRDSLKLFQDDATLTVIKNRVAEKKIPADDATMELAAEVMEKHGVESEFGFFCMRAISQDRDGTRFGKKMQVLLRAKIQAMEDCANISDFGKEGYAAMKKERNEMMEMQQRLVEKLQTMPRADRDNFAKKIQPRAMALLQKIMNAPDEKSREEFKKSLDRQDKECVMAYQICVQLGRMEDMPHQHVGC
jgi:hypothetical protein